MGKLPLVSVVIPTYNREKTINYCLDSILNQTYSPFEVIIVDDCSVDNTVEIVKSYQDTRIRCIVLDKNSGAQAARNRGIKESKGNWIAFQDSDDEWINKKLEIQVELIKFYNYDPEIVLYSNCYRYYPSQNVKELWELPVIEPHDSFFSLLIQSSPMFQSIITSKVALEKIGYLDENVPSYQEWDTSIRLAKICRFIHIKEPLFIYYFHEGETISKNIKKDIEGYGYIINKFEFEIKKYCGSKIWEKHITNQIKKCINYEFWEYGKQYLKKLNFKNKDYYDFKKCIKIKVNLEKLKNIRNINKGIFMEIIYFPIKLIKFSFKIIKFIFIRGKR